MQNDSEPAGPSKKTSSSNDHIIADLTKWYQQNITSGKPRVYSAQTGKGGAGKSTIIAQLHSVFRHIGINPILINCDANPNCAYMTGTDPGNIAPIEDRSAMLDILTTALKISDTEMRPILIDSPADGATMNGKAINPAATLLSCGLSRVADMTVIIPVSPEQGAITKALELLPFYSRDLRTRLVLGLRIPRVDSESLGAARKSIARWSGGETLLRAVPDVVAIPDLGTLIADWQASNSSIPSMPEDTLQHIALRETMPEIVGGLRSLIEYKFPR